MKTIFITDKRQPTGLHFTTNHTGKMAGIYSLSTSVLHNEQCAKNRAIKGSICAKCFAARQMAYKTNNDLCFELNGKILNSKILDSSLLPVTNCIYFRFEAFGDLASWIQAANYIQIAKKNPQTNFALWTKNPHFIAEAIRQGYKKPKNLNIIYSSLFVDRINKPNFDFIDKIFTVWTNEQTAKNNGQEINCGARSCFICARCYKKTKGIELINELLK